MDQNTKHEFPTRTKKNPSKLFLAVIVTFVFSSLVVGITVYFFMNRTIDSEVESTKSYYEQRVNTLETEVSSLGEEIKQLEEEVDTSNNDDINVEEDNEEDADVDEEDSDDNTSSITPPAINFIKEGNLTEGPKLLYEEPGNPALSVNLIYTNTTTCTHGFAICDPRFLDIGSRMQITGIKSGNDVTVYHIRVI